MQIIRNSFVTLRQRVSDIDGRVVDDGGEPIRYLHGGYGGLFPKVEAALEGKGVGEAVEVVLKPEEAFGPRDPALEVMAPAGAFAEPPQLGDEVEREVGGVGLRYRVTAVDGDTIRLDGNHPLAGMSLTFSATVMEVRPAAPAEAEEEIANLGRALAEGKATDGAHARAAAAAEAEKEEAELARAEAAGLVETVYLPQLGSRLRFVFRSQTHKLCWLAPLFLLPALGYWVFSRGFENGAMAVAGLWVAWSFLAPGLIGRAIDRWGFRFLFFDFSPNVTPSVLERRLVTGGQVFSVAAVLGFTLFALFRLDHLSDLWSLLGADFALAFVLTVLLAILAPFLVMILTGFRVRPVIDKAPPAPSA